MNLQEILNQLSEEQKEELKRLLFNEDMKSDTTQVIFCPKCKSFHVVKNGKHHGNQRFICKDCGCHFTEYKNTIFNSTKKDISLWKSYIKEMFEGKSLKQIAKDLNICIQTSFRWRHKVLSVIEDKFNNDVLEGIVEADETLVLSSHKGTHIDGVKPRKRGGKANFRGISHEQQGVLVAVDRNKNVVSRVYGTGRITSQNVKSILNNRIESKSVLVTDGCSAYNEYAKENELDLVKLVKVHKKGIYHINNVNGYHSRLKEFMIKFHGVATKYLDKYVSWYKFVNQKNDTAFLFNELILGR